MLAGTNTFSFLISDISGNPVIGLTTSDFDYYGKVTDTAIIYDTVNEIASGFYQLLANIPVGQGFLEVIPKNTMHYITPSYFDVDATEVYGTDDIYSTLARNTLDITQVSLTSYEGQAIGPYKEGDDWVIDYVIPNAVTPDISGYSNFKASLFDSRVLTSITGSGFIADFILTVDTPNKLVTMHMPASGSSAIIDEGLLQEYFYSDLQATDDNGYNKTLAEFTILARRNFTRP